MAFPPTEQALNMLEAGYGVVCVILLDSLSPGQMSTLFMFGVILFVVVITQKTAHWIHVAAVRLLSPFLGVGGGGVSWSAVTYMKREDLVTDYDCNQRRGRTGR